MLPIAEENDLYIEWKKVNDWVSPEEGQVRPVTNLLLFFSKVGIAFHFRLTTFKSIDIEIVVTLVPLFLDYAFCSEGFIHVIPHILFYLCSVFSYLRCIIVGLLIYY